MIEYNNFFKWFFPLVYMVKEIGKLIDSLLDGFLQDAVKKIYYELESSSPLFECQIAEKIISPSVIGSPILHSSYVRTALDILVSENYLKIKKAKYSLKE